MTPVAVHVHPGVAAVCALYDGLLGAQAARRGGLEHLRLLADRVAAGHRSHHPGARVELSNWHPDLAGRADAVWAVELSDRDYRDTVARGHGYPDWAAALAAQPVEPAPDFERCVEAVLSGDREAVAGLLDQHPGLVTARSHWGHGATLLHYLAANGVETHRQRVPANAADMAQLLLDRGADPTATAHMYGGGQTVLGLLLTSSHPADAGVTDEVARVLRRAAPPPPV
ncbi:hypothetical protein [Pseudonocardia lacus]|uniref:hypothetical protein n=1 Tax=Pseudonocardia lacus TaxID=2835865 RepID=UPI001BDC086B|nr:hypothetical protein [Pseudonocardia lacus]